MAPKNTIFDSILQNWSVIEEIVDVLHFAFETTTALEKSTLTLSDVFGAMLKMEFKLRKLTLNSARHTIFAEILLEKISNRKTSLIICPAMLCAVYLDPRYCIDLTANETKVAKYTLDNFYMKWKRRSDALRVETTQSVQEDSFEEYRTAKRKRITLSTTEDDSM